MICGHNVDPLHEHSNDHQLEFFSKAGSLMVKSKNGKGTSFYGQGSETTALALFQPMWMLPGIENKALALQLLFWLRDPRGGAGNRSGFRECLRWLAAQCGTSSDQAGATWLGVNLTRIPGWGRWDDLAELYGTCLERLAAGIWTEAIMRGDHLACKWAKVDMVPLQRALRINEHGLRKLIVPPRSTIVERAMCSGEWATVDYSKIPSKAMNMYTKAFRVHDAVRFEEYKTALARGDKGVKINATTLFPHDCVKQARTGDEAIAEAQFKALPDFIGSTDRRIMVLADRSGSMSDVVVSDVTRDMVAVALALYCSDRLGTTNPFYRQYLEFSSEPVWVDWRGESFVKTCWQGMNGYAGTTDIQKALDMMLASAVAWKLPVDQMITTLVIVSDMQFDGYSADSGHYSPYGIACCGTDKTVIERCMQQWEAAGYRRPNIVYWNLAGYAGQPAKVDTPNTALVSGFSPSILKSLLSGIEVSPREVMLQAIAKYQVDIPFAGET